MEMHKWVFSCAPPLILNCELSNCVDMAKLSMFPCAQLGAMDTFARGLKNAVTLQDQGVMAAYVQVGASLGMLTVDSLNIPAIVNVSMCVPA